MPKDETTLRDMADKATQEEAENLEFEDEAQGENGQDGAAPEFSPDLMGVVLAGLFKSVANIACARAGVSPVSDAEARAVGDAAAGVAAFYDFEMSPQAAAWLGLGIAVAGVAMPRMEEYAATVDIPSPLPSGDDVARAS